MKKSIILSLLLFTLAAVSYAKPKPLWNLKVLSVKKNVLYFKVNKSFVGGTVEVYDSDQKFIEAE
ncbi:MAG TPA: hypothetical protein VKQ08_05085, partial [Cyclobacteriaceae bacterium]|nr:hypothetical protein [Cyclobacteriaceae bacterium]